MQFLSSEVIPVMAAVAVWKKVVSVGRFPPGDGPQSLQHFLFLHLWFCLIICLSLCVSDSQLSFYYWSAASSNSCVLSFSCSLYFLSSPFCSYPLKANEKKTISESYFWNSCIKMNENQTKAVHEKQRDMKNKNSRSVSNGVLMKVLQ